MLGRADFGKPQAAVWLPRPEHFARSRLAAAMKRWGFDSLTALHRASVDRPDWFWPAAVEDLAFRCAAKCDGCATTSTVASSRAGSRARR
jgi:acetyl-CoA synthetase